MKSFGHVIIASFSLVLLGTCPSTASAAASCADLEQRIFSASRTGEADVARQLYLEAEAEQACSGEQLLLMGRNTAFAFYHRAYSDGVSEAEQNDMLRDALGFGRPWQVLAALADLEKAERQYAEAAALYQEALDDIRDETLNPTAPPIDVVASIHKKAEETRLLADHYVRRIDRNGDPGGLAQRHFRGFEAQRVAVPVHFEFDSDAFTAEGQRAVLDMLDYLTAEGSLDIGLVGHTDPRGTSDYNQTLSLRRAAAVKEFLTLQGYAGEVQIAGRGEAEPFESDDPGAYTQDEIWQLDRRVELQR